ncbi:MAG: GAF domain-containing protein, partial [Gemmatimonadota bacterium]
MEAPQGSPAADPAARLAARGGRGGGTTSPSEVPGWLAEAGRELDADRVYVFENIRGPDGRLWMNLDAEWLREGTRGLFDDPTTTLHPYAPDFTRWLETLGDHGVLTGRVADMPEEERRILRAEDTASMAAVPIFLEQEWWGYVAADDCRGGRTWGPAELEMLGMLAASIAEDVKRRRRISTDAIIGDRYRAIVEHVPAVTYIDALNDAASSLYVSPQVEELLGYPVRDW